MDAEPPEAVDAQPVDAEPVDADPAEAVDAEPVEAEPVDAEPTEVEVAPRCRRVTDFVGDAQQQSWAVTLDGVMGGRSSGDVAFSDSTMIFTGELVTQGGGFSLVRTSLFADEFVEGSFLVLRARTDGRTYEMVFKDRLAGRQGQLFHEAAVPLIDSADWQQVRVELSDLFATSNGRAVDVEPFDKDAVSEMGIILKDGIDGDFSIEVDWVDICAAS